MPITPLPPRKKARFARTKPIPLGIALLTLATSLGADPSPALLFYSSLDHSTTADFAAGDRAPLTASGVQVEASSARFAANAGLTYDARANLYAEQGTVSFWWRPDEALGRLGFPLFSVSYGQHSTWDFNFARIEWTGAQLSARIRDRNLLFHTVRASQPPPPPGRWLHVALTWSEPGGVALFLDGRLAARTPGPLHLDASLDQFGLLTRAVTPHHTSGTENAGSIDEIRIYAVPLGPGDVARLAARQEPLTPQRAVPDWKSRFGWRDGVGIPLASSLTVERLPILEANDLGKFWLKGADGKRETTWPMVGHGYAGEGKTYRLRPAAGPCNLVRTTGNLAGRVGSRPRSAAELLYLAASSGPEPITVERDAGVLADLECLRLGAGREAPEGRWLTFAPTDGRDFAARRDPATFTVWQPGSAQPGPSGQRYHYFRLPAGEETALEALRLRLASTPGAYYYVSILDPLTASRQVIEIDVQAQRRELDLTLDFPDLIVPAGRSLVVTLASSDPAAPRVEIQLLPAPAARARATHTAERLAQIRDAFQLLSEARPWMRVGRSLPLPALRRQLKLVDELYALLEDVRRVDPAEPIAAAYWGWINRTEPPPPFTEPAGLDWAQRQLRLLTSFRQIVDWWIEHRQIATGELGGGLGDDTDMIQNWPAVALLDGPTETIRRSVRRVLEACYAQGLVDRGMNAHRTDALHAYEEGMNAYGPAFLVDYGNPVLFERMLETASHYPRLTGVNAAGHRHFRSYQYSTTDLVEEGYHAREDIYSHLILHPGLYVAWYNGSPAVKTLLGEFGDSLLAHWKSERYPNLAKRIFFAGDRVEERAAPNSETFNLFWGLYALDRDDKYLWLLREAVRAGDLARAGAVNGPWLGVYEPSDITGRLEAEVRRRRIDDHNLQTDQAGLVARALAWQAGSDRRLVEEADRALLQHLDQNLYLYTEAEQFTDRIWIPTLSVQRARLGGVAHYRNHIYPGHAVSWENTGGEVAALVPLARPDALRLLVYNAGPAERQVTVRVWQLENGRYQVTAGDSTQTLPLKRYSPVSLRLPSRQTVTVEFRQLGKGPPLSQLPDLAIAAEEARENGGLEIPVHNIGAVPSGPFTVTVQNRSGQVLARRTQPSLGAPLDLKPRVTVVRFPNVALRPGLAVMVARDEPGQEICDENNRFVYNEGL